MASLRQSRPQDGTLRQHFSATTGRGADDTLTYGVLRLPGRRASGTRRARLPFPRPDLALRVLTSITDSFRSRSPCRHFSCGGPGVRATLLTTGGLRSMARPDLSTTTRPVCGQASRWFADREVEGTTPCRWRSGGKTWRPARRWRFDTPRTGCLRAWSGARVSSRHRRN